MSFFIVLSELLPIIFVVTINIRSILKIQQRKLVLKTNRETGEQNVFLSDEVERWLFKRLASVCILCWAGRLVVGGGVGDNSGLRLALVLFSVFCLKLINRANPPPPPSPADAVNSDCEFCRRLASAVWSNFCQPGATEPRGEIFLLDSVYDSCEKYWVISCRFWYMSYNQLSISQLVCIELNFQIIIL